MEEREELILKEPVGDFTQPGIHRPKTPYPAGLMAARTRLPIDQQETQLTELGA